MDSNFKINVFKINIMLRVNTCDIAIITVKNVDYCCIIHKFSKFEAIILLKNIVLYLSLSKTISYFFC